MTHHIVRSYTIYNIDGYVLRCVSCPPQMKILQRRQNEYIVDGESDPNLHRVVAGEIVDRPDNLAEVVGTTINNVPVPSTMRIGSESYPVNSPTVELDLPLAGTYNIRLESFPYKDKMLQVVVT